jgi:hypothetical protein
MQKQPTASREDAAASTSASSLDLLLRMRSRWKATGSKERRIRIGNKLYTGDLSFQTTQNKAENNLPHANNSIGGNFVDQFFFAQGTFHVLNIEAIFLKHNFRIQGDIFQQQNLLLLRSFHEETNK